MDRDDRLRSAWPAWLFFLLIIIHLYPVWSVRHFPSQDGPAHVENAVIVRDFGSNSGELYRRYYVLSHALEPNYLTHAALALLSAVLPPEDAHKVLVSVFVISLPLAGWYACAVTRRDAGVYAVLIFPFIYGLALQKGIYNFCLSLAMFLLSVGFYLRHGGLAKRAFAGLAVLGLLTYLTHIVSFVMVVITIALLSLRGESSDDSAPRTFFQRIKPAGLSLVAFLPTLALAMFFFFRHTSPQTQHLPFGVLLVQLGTLAALVSYTRMQIVVALLLAIALGATAIISLFRKWRGRSLDRRDLLLAAAIAAISVYFIAPNAASGGSQISFRLSLFPWLLLILWLANNLTGQILRPVLIGIGVVTSLAMVFANIRTFHQLDDYLGEFTSAGEHIQPGSTFLPVFRTRFDYAADGSLISKKVRPFVHAGGIIAVQRHAIDLSNYEANTGYFPVMFRPEMNPAVLLDESENDLLNYVARTEGRGSIDYVLIWDTSNGKAAAAPEVEHRLATLMPQLERGYELIYTSPRGFVHLYQQLPKG